MSVAPYLYGNKSTPRKRREALGMDALKSDDSDGWYLPTMIDGRTAVDYIDYDTEARAARGAEPYIVDGQSIQRDFYACGCCDDLKQFDIAHTSDAGRRIQISRESAEARKVLLTVCDQCSSSP